jgi:hypothetical protein
MQIAAKETNTTWMCLYCIIIIIIPRKYWGGEEEIPWRKGHNQESSLCSPSQNPSSIVLPLPSFPTRACHGPGTGAGAGTEFGSGSEKCGTGPFSFGSGSEQPGTGPLRLRLRLRLNWDRIYGSGSGSGSSLQGAGSGQRIFWSSQVTTGPRVTACFLLLLMYL